VVVAGNRAKRSSRAGCGPTSDPAGQRRDPTPHSVHTFHRDGCRALGILALRFMTRRSMCSAELHSRQAPALSSVLMLRCGRRGSSPTVRKGFFCAFKPSLTVGLLPPGSHSPATQLDDTTHRWNLLTEMQRRLQLYAQHNKGCLSTQLDADRAPPAEGYRLTTPTSFHAATNTSSFHCYCNLRRRNRGGRGLARSTSS